MIASIEDEYENLYDELTQGQNSKLKLTECMHCKHNSDKIETTSDNISDDESDDTFDMTSSTTSKQKKIRHHDWSESEMKVKVKVKVY